MDRLRQRCMECRKCELCGTRTNLVFGDGQPDAEVMFVGEGPGENEDLQGIPFVGKGGQLLSDMLKIIDLDRSKNFYIANIVKCRPPKNRDPLPAEQDACIGWLREQIEVVNPKIIVCLGRIAAKVLIKDNFMITREHGVVFRKDDGRCYMALYHPAALLRDPGKKPDTFVDLKTLQELIGQTCAHTYE